MCATPDTGSYHAIEVYVRRRGLSSVGVEGPLDLVVLVGVGWPLDVGGPVG